MEQLEDLIIDLQRESSYKKIWSYGMILFGIFLLIAIFIDIDHIAIIVLVGLAAAINYRFAKDAELKIRIVEQIIEIKKIKKTE